jgi:hypothetical protein
MVPNPAIPTQWFKADIRLGSLTIRLDEDTWSKCTMSYSEYKRMKAAFSSQGETVSKIEMETTSGTVNLGERLIA